MPANGGLWFVCHSKICAKIRLYSFGQCSVSFARYDYPRIPQTSPRYALQRYNKRYDPGYDLDTLGYAKKCYFCTKKRHARVTRDPLPSPYSRSWAHAHKLNSTELLLCSRGYGKAVSKRSPWTQSSALMEHRCGPRALSRVYLAVL